ncbi:hypothetical protein HELRODRAFT_81791, partial [Helobdella robusta]|uniref:EGF-like domain-containing protein n=1 Tax=Helobdella robusta TaxID=6412 RepID=T1G4I8_HELRO
DCGHNCSNKGDCVGGRCRCQYGFAGRYCQEAACVKECNGRGLHASGHCICNDGWMGSDCGLQVNTKNQILCRNGGVCYDGRCLCPVGFAGESCSVEVCDPPCVNGYCKDRKCVCFDGYAGMNCSIRRCDTRCSGIRGTCHDGVCICGAGWYGTHCSMDGCPNACSSRGKCEMISLPPPPSYSTSCRCDNGWSGSSCNVPVEYQCDDKIDNDQDTLVDCNDPDCCSVSKCMNTILCKSATEPHNQLRRNEASCSTEAFYERVKFLVDAQNVQLSAHKDVFNDSLVVLLVFVWLVGWLVG